MGGLLSLVNFQSFLALFLITSVILSPSKFVTEASETLDTNNGDRQTLLLIKSQLSDPSGALASWRNNNTSFCRWHGVSCNNQARVTGLDLSSLTLAGALSPYITNLTFLQRIDMSNNNIFGPIHPDFARISGLEHLNLSLNSLDGKISSGLLNCPSLVSVDLSKNSLQGRIPDFVSNPLQSLVHLSLARNNLTGTIPRSIGNISSLIHLDLSENLLKGSIPQSLQKLQNLQHLNLYYNYFEEFPSSLFNRTTLTYLNLGYNSVSGALPSTIGYTLPNIQTLDLGVNQFASPIPTSLSNASHLQNLVLSGNSFNGEVPTHLGLLHELTYLDLSWNQLESGDWSFLSSLTNCKNVRFLNLIGNNLTGILPNTVGNLTKGLEMLLLGKNNISGTIPNEIGNLVNLTALYLDRNHLTGILPPIIGSLRNLQTLQLSTNMLSGPIPSSIGNLTQLSELWLMENQFNGTIPTSIGNCKHLLRLKLCRNNLEGNIPKEIFSITNLSQEFDLSNNSLEGTIPWEVSSLINLPILYLSLNNLHGEIPPALGDCQILQQLLLGGNHFEGSIPESLINLKGIKYLDLSRNNLSGQIPKYFESFGSLAYLNLSFNSLEGNVPGGGIFSNASGVSLLGNLGLCGGDSFLDLPPCSIESSKHKLNRKKISIILIAASAALISILVLSIGTVVYRLNKKKRGTKHGVTCLEDALYRKVSYYELLRATEEFSLVNFVGKGSFGSVYRGKLDEEGSVAVKVFDLDQTGGQRCFTAECESLRNVRHRNLVNVITSCSTVDSKGNEFKALVFRYIPNGSLEEWIHPMVQGKKLCLAQRINVAVDIASALSYLHHHCVPPLIHCDLKLSNVLIDGDMNALVSDFGLARFLPDFTSSVTQSTTSLIRLKGTIGYIAPGKYLNLHFIVNV
jgi:Leucine-rich repeat (LRR) protein